MAKKSTTVKTKNSKTDSHQKLHRLHVFSAVAFVILAVLTAALMKTTTYKLDIGYLAKDELLSQTSTVLTPASHYIFDIELRWVLAIVLVLSAIIPILSITKLHDKYHQYLKDGIQKLRWMDYAVTLALTLEIVALICGVSDIMALKLIGGLVGVTAVLGWVSERQNKGANTPVWSPFVISVFTGALPWVVIAASIIGSHVYGMVRLPWYAYASAVAVFVGYTLLALNQFNYLRRLKKWQNYEFVERNYAALNLVTKAALTIVLVVGLK
jgi:hypothetical protein